MKTIALGSCLLFCLGIQCAIAEPLSDNRIAGEVSNLLQWKMFWEGPGSYQASYRPGATVDATVVSFNDQIAVFIAEVRTSIYITIQRGDVVNRAVRGMGPGSLPDIIRKYLADRNATPGFVFRPEVPLPLDAPVRRESSKQTAAPPDTRVIRLRLPPMTPPEYVLSKRRPPELEALIAAARDRVSGYHASVCGGASVTIPFFSVQDPAVYAYADLGSGCQSGVMPFIWDGTKWTGGQFWPNSPPDDWSYTIGQIRKYSLAQFSLP